MSSDPADERFPAFVAVGIAVVLSIGVLVVGSVRFARLDWSGLPLTRAPIAQDRIIDAECSVHLRPYVTASGRTISPVTVDEQQYLAMVQALKGVPRNQLQVGCLLAPFATRTAVPWLASLLPFDEAVGLGVVNLVMTLIATWAIVLTLRAQGAGVRPTAVVAGLFAVSWNTFMFGSALLVDAGAVALVALCWLAVASRRPWLVPAVLLVSYPVKETVALVVLVPLAAWCWNEVRSSRRTSAGAVGLIGTAALATLVSFAAADRWFLDARSVWPLSPSTDALIDNLLSPVGLVAFLIGVVPLFGPALLVIRRRLDGSRWFDVVSDPAVAGVAVTALLLVWVTLAADLSARFGWVGMPYAASLAVIWFDSGRCRRWLSRFGRSVPDAAG